MEGVDDVDQAALLIGSAYPHRSTWLLEVLMEFQQPTLTKLQIAQIQLERAVFLCMDDRDFVSAITLAGAAEEILGNAVAAAERESAVQNSAAAISAFNVVSGGTPVQKKAAISELNSARDSLKHFGDGKPVTFDFEEEAYQLIDRAVSNLLLLNQTPTPAMVELLSSNRCRSPQT